MNGNPAVRTESVCGAPSSGLALRRAMLTILLTTNLTLSEAWSAEHKNAWEIAVGNGQRLEAEGRYAEARSAFEDALREAQDLHLGKATIALSLDGLATVEQDLGSYLNAETLYERALATLGNPNGPDRLADSIWNHLAVLYLESERYQKAEPILKRGLARADGESIPDNAIVAQRLNDLASLYMIEGKSHEAKALLVRALTLLEETLLENDPGHGDATRAMTLENLAFIAASLGDYKQGIPLAERSLKILNHMKSPGPPSQIEVFSVLGVLYSRTGRMKDAERSLDKALRIAEEVYGAEHPYVAYVLSTYSRALKYAKRKREAKPMAERARAILAGSARDNGLRQTIDASSLRRSSGKTPEVSPVP
jgi:tetratricopeptide (TPR) repeat protein